MTYKGDISAEKRALILVYYKYLHWKVKDIQENLQVSRASIYRIKNLPISNRKARTKGWLGIAPQKVIHVLNTLATASLAKYPNIVD